MSTGPSCSSWAREAGVRPLGTAAHATGWLLVDWPLPWPKDPKHVEALAPVRDAVRGTGIRIQLVVPSEGDGRRVVLHDDGPDDDGWFDRHRRREAVVGGADVVDAARSLVTDRDAGEPIEATDVLICAHGTRDRCCGSLGTALAMTAAAAGANVRRTSHLGGHRFAATALLLPEGTSWGYLEPESLDALVTRSRPPAELAPNLRGSTALDGAGMQAADGAALAEVGWAWLDGPRRARPAADGTADSYDVESRDHGSWRVTVEKRRRLPVPVCGEAPESAPKAETEMEIVAIVPTAEALDR